MSSSSGRRAARCGTGGSRVGLGGPPLVCRASACTAAFPCGCRGAQSAQKVDTTPTLYAGQRHVLAERTKKMQTGLQALQKPGCRLGCMPSAAHT